MQQDDFNRLMRGFYDSEKWDAYDDDKNRLLSHLILRTDMWSRRNSKALRQVLRNQRAILRESREDEAVREIEKLDQILAELEKEEK